MQSMRSRVRSHGRRPWESVRLNLKFELILAGTAELANLARNFWQRNDGSIATVC